VATILAHNVELLAAAALVFVYLALMNGHMQSIDGLLTYRQAHSIGYNRSLQLDPPIWWSQGWTTSKFGIGLSLLYLPGLFVFSWLRPLVPVPDGAVYDFRLLYADPLYAVAAAPVQIIITAASAYLVALVLRQLGYRKHVALFGLAIYGLASPALVYARGDFTQPLTALCWIAGIYAALRFRRSGGLGALAATAASVFYAVLTRPVEGSVLFLALALLLAPRPRLLRWRLEDWRNIGSLCAAYGASVVVTLLINWMRFGSPFVTGYEGVGWTTPLPIGLVGSLLSPGRGLLWEFPALVLVPLGARRLMQEGRLIEVCALAGSALLQLLNVAAFEAWWGGWDWGLRLFVPALPVLAVMAAIGLTALPLRIRFWLPAGLFLGGVIWAVPAVVTDLLGGYASTYDGTAQSFSWMAYPPIGAWRFLHHLRATSVADSGAVDILWIRLAHATNNLSLLPGLAFVVVAVLLGRRVLNLQRAPDEV
jgi:hypothetical protein